MTKKNSSTGWWLEVTRRCDRAIASSRSASAASARPSLSLALLLVLVPVWMVLIPSVLHARTITVNTTADPGTFRQCGLRAAITNANNKTSSPSSSCVAGTGNDTINFNVSGTITLGSTLPAIQNTLTIDGSRKAITLSGNNLYQVLVVNSGATLNLNELTIADGNAGGGDGGGIDNDGTLNVTNSTFSGNGAVNDDGGGIKNENDATLNITNSTFSDNKASDVGGGIDNDGTLTVTNSTFSDNKASEGSGGGIYNNGTLTVTNSTFFDDGAFEGGGIRNDGTLSVTNSAFYDNRAHDGGGIENTGTLHVTNGTFSDNSCAAGDGGGIDNNGTLTVTNSTFSSNSAPSDQGGGIFSEGTLMVTNSTFYDNSAAQGGGIYNAATATVANSILADSTGGNCVGDTITDGGYNISDDGTCGFTGTGANGDTIGDGVTDAHLALDPSGLQDNGGPTDTIALESGSYAIDAIPIDLCPVTDQRGFPRPDPASPAETACDIGAFESGSVPEVTLTPSTLDFGTESVGQSSASQTVTLINGTGQTLRITGWSIGPDFTIVSTTCPAPPSDLAGRPVLHLRSEFPAEERGNQERAVASLRQRTWQSAGGPPVRHRRGPLIRSEFYDWDKGGKGFSDSPNKRVAVPAKPPRSRHSALRCVEDLR